MSQKLSLIKVVLSTNRAVFLRKMKISDSETAAQQCALRANGDPNVLQILMQKALVQLLIIKIQEQGGEPRTLSANEKEDMDSLFDTSEYGQILRVINHISGGSEGGKMPVMEMVME